MEAMSVADLVTAIMTVRVNDGMTALLAPVFSRTSNGVAAVARPYTEPSTEPQKSRKRNWRLAP